DIEAAVLTELLLFEKEISCSLFPKLLGHISCVTSHIILPRILLLLQHSDSRIGAVALLTMRPFAPLDSKLSFLVPRQMAISSRHLRCFHNAEPMHSSFPPTHFWTAIA